jgi:hypothetical protein
MAWIEFEHYQELRTRPALAGHQSHQMTARGFLERFACVQAALREDALAAQREQEELEAQRLASIAIQQREAHRRAFGAAA